MNLLTDPWVPVMRDGGFQHITYKEVLCSEGDYQISLPRDDMEMAALQLLICLTQVIFMPPDAPALRQREASPMTEADFDKGIEPYAGMFDLFHPTQPFMQTRGVKANEATPIQKLFVGLPEGNNHALFNNAGEVVRVCPACVAIALFNQASNCPSFGGGFKGGLRGGAPITTFVSSMILRQAIWRNVLSGQNNTVSCASSADTDLPVWVRRIEKNQKLSISDVGLFRGLFWQPAHVELVFSDSQSKPCDCCGSNTNVFVTGFSKEKFGYELSGTWPHPHSPRYWEKDVNDLRFVSFRADSPVWTQLLEYVIKRTIEGKAGYIPAATVTQHRSVWPGDMALCIGGYRNKQAAIIERRHELISLRQGWADQPEMLEAFIDVGVNIKTALRSKTYGFGKEIGVTGLAVQAERLFYQRSEPVVHSALQQMDFDQFWPALEAFAERLIDMARGVFEEVVTPYVGQPKALRAQATARRTLGKALGKIAAALQGDL